MFYDMLWFQFSEQNVIVTLFYGIWYGEMKKKSDSWVGVQKYIGTVWQGVVISKCNRKVIMAQHGVNNLKEQQK